MRVLDLFSGLGGWSLGLEAAGAFHTKAFVEIDPFCQKVLAHHWPGVPIYSDVRHFVGTPHSFEVLAGGFPCQNISQAANFWGSTPSILGDRSGLWWQYLRLIEEIQPNWVLIENVKALLTKGLEQVLYGLANLGYDAEWHVIPAYAVGLPHRRERVWVAAHLNHRRGKRNSPFPLAGLRSAPFQALCRHVPSFLDRPDLPEPLFRGGHDGVSTRMDRLTALGNSLVPTIPYYLGKAILEWESQ